MVARAPRPLFLLIVTALLAAGCGGDARDASAAQTAAHAHDGAADATGDPAYELDSAALEEGRNDPSWKEHVAMDPASASADTTAESLEDIRPETVNRADLTLPVGPGMKGPSVLAVQILLDRARFSPGVMDGRWGKNTEKAVFWFQRAHDLRATGRVDEQTLERLRSSGGGGDLVEARSLSAADVEGPFVTIPEDIYEKADMECMCYESVGEKVAELVHATPELLERLNPGSNLDALAQGDQVWVPSVQEDMNAPGGEVARVVISDGGHYVHAVDASERILFHFPSTLGSKYAPSPTGDYSIESIHHDPEWHYQPGLLTGVPDDEPDAMIPPGPNNAVGVVWMQLSRPHYGIHGTSAPSTIGYATSHGCVRLTNWDVQTLARHVSAGTPVQFVDETSSD